MASMLQDIQKAGKDKFCDRDITLPSPTEHHHQFYNYFNPNLLNPQLIAHQTAALLSAWPFHNMYPSPLFSGWPIVPPTMPFESKPLLSPLLVHQMNNNYIEEEDRKKNFSYTSQASTSTPISSPASHSGDSLESIEKKEAAKPKVFTCNVCQKTFGYKHVLQNHEKTHTGEKSHVCTVCNKRFRRDHHLKVHQRLHTGVRPYSCTFPNCDRQFVQVANLRRHLKTHEDKNVKEEEKIHVNDVKIIRIAKPECNNMIYQQCIESDYDYYYKPEKYSEEQTEPEDLSMHAAKKLC